MQTTNEFTNMLLRVPNYPDTGNWKERHVAAIQRPRSYEFPIVTLLHGWLAYAEIHEDEYASRIGDDYVLGKEWEVIGDAIRGLLNGNCGRLDCGTIDGIVLDAMKLAGIDTGDK